MDDSSAFWQAVDRTKAETRRLLLDGKLSPSEALELLQYCASQLVKAAAQFLVGDEHKRALVVAGLTDIYVLLKPAMLAGLLPYLPLRAKSLIFGAWLDAYVELHLIPGVVEGVYRLVKPTL